MSESATASHKSAGFLAKYRWWIIGGLAVIAILVFFFVSKSNQNAAASSSTNGGAADDTANSDLLSELLPELLDSEAGNDMYGSAGSYESGATGPAGPAGPAGATGPAGANGATGAAGTPGLTTKTVTTAPGSTLKTSAPAAKTTAIPKSGVITVQPDQTLLSLSEEYFGTGNRTELAHMNGLGTGAGLKTGQVLKV
jgi:hypothetical protein